MLSRQVNQSVDAVFVIESLAKVRSQKLNYLWRNENARKHSFTVTVITLIRCWSERKRCWGWWHPGRDFVVALFFGLKIREDQKKSFAAKLVGFQSNSMWRPKKNRSSPNNQWVFDLNENGDRTKWTKKGIHHKSVELWFHLKMVTPGTTPLDPKVY